MIAPYRVAIASRPEAREAAEEILALGGTAVDAALAGFLASAGATSWALFAPITIAVAGAGSGVRFVDGRARQPGKDLERPRRYAEERSIPAIALASVPLTPVAIALAQAMFGQTPWSQLIQPALRAARKEGAEARVTLLDQLSKKKVLLLADRDLHAELRNRAPRIDGALLGPEDFEDPRVDVVRGEHHKIAGHPAELAPWAADPALAGVVDNGRLAVLAADHRGSLAAVLADRPARGLPLFDGDVELPLLAQPMLKGIPRLKPGSHLPMAAPLAVLLDGERPTSIAASLRRSIHGGQLGKLLASGETPLTGWGEHATDRTDDLLVVRRSV